MKIIYTCLKFLFILSFLWLIIYITSNVIFLKDKITFLEKALNSNSYETLVGSLEKNAREVNDNEIYSILEKKSNIKPTKIYTKGSMVIYLYEFESQKIVVSKLEL